MHLLADLAAGPTFATWIFLGLALALALGFEFVNGFHDTANAVATVIYTQSLKPNAAVIWSGICNLAGVLLSSGLVAYSIVNLLPVELVLNVGSGAGFAMVFALLISAIIWNMGTWYLGLPASSSHTLIGSILGVGIANSLLTGHSFSEGVNWAKAQEVGISLLLSPLCGFVWAAVLLLLLKLLVRKPELFSEPEKGKAPPWWIRGILIGTCTGVSFFHGSNDGQKGMGLIVLILVGILPGTYALHMSHSPERIHALMVEAQAARVVFEKKAGDAKIDQTKVSDELSAYLKTGGALRPETFAALATASQTIETHVAPIKTFADLPESDRRSVRTDMYLVGNAIAKLQKGKKISEAEGAPALATFQKELDSVTKYIPDWVKVAVAIALGLGTTIGWKRIVVTVGEKIGKSHLTYAQGACAELVAMITIALADTKGWPVSTTHVLSSGVAGTMAANKSGLQAQTLRNILLAWVLTLPVCIFLGSLLFAFGNYVVLNVLGLK
ncbi:MAG TPA: inorganic phosphate transporter [Chthoniobacter sp.]|nr:inorganic phosphate transporter [Chthoniobacter sp.]